jgi:hypothetical protein
MEEVAEDGKESTNSAHANGMNVLLCVIYQLNFNVFTYVT